MTVTRARTVTVLTHQRPSQTGAALERLREAAARAGVELRFDPEETRKHELHVGENSIRCDAPLSDDVELCIVLGGDGTILRAAEIVRGTDVPVLGVNLGHVGFLAEAEREDLGDTIRRVVAREWEVEERLALEVRVLEGSEVVHTDWALNEATVEKASRERMIEVVMEVDGRPLSSFGCDGVVISTPTGSTAYAFSGGGPVVWPTLDAILVVPLSAHALFARPLVVPPRSVVAIEMLRRATGAGVLWCDGRRTFDLVLGTRVEVRASDTPVRLARLHSQVDRFTDRLVRKFDLPVAGWRGPAA